MDALGAPLFRASSRDGFVLGAAIAHAALLVGALAFATTGAPSPLARAALALGLALAMNWSSNTTSHIHLHGPLFRSGAANAGFSVFLSVLLGVPQSWWKLFHLEHHGLLPSRDSAQARALRTRGALELAALLAFVVPFAVAAPLSFVTVYAPAMALGFALCANQGRQEHRGSAEGVDIHAPLYNRLWFNDGFHAAHHRAPEAHWTTLPARAAAGDLVSPLPPLVRWLDEMPALANRAAASIIDALERATLGLPFVRRFLLTTHERAWTALLGSNVAAIRTVTIVGGGLFPRTALVLARLLPHARLTLIDAVPAHLDRARAFLEPVTRERPEVVRFVAGVFDQSASAHADLLVVPLAYRGDRRRLYAAPPAPRVAVHDWLWRRRGADGRRVSLLLLKRLNLITA
jgi:hypothetical protein